MEKPRNKARAPGMDFLGIPMKADIKEKIRTAAELKRRTMADWARLELERASEAVIAAHALKTTTPQPLPMAAETKESIPLPPRKQVIYPKALRKPNSEKLRKKQA